MAMLHPCISPTLTPLSLGHPPQITSNLPHLSAVMAVHLEMNSSRKPSSNGAPLSVPHQFAYTTSPALFRLTSTSITPCEIDQMSSSPQRPAPTTVSLQ